MTKGDREERLHALAEAIDEVLAEHESFVLVIFPRTEPEKKTKIAFDVISNHTERSYVSDVLEHVVRGIDEHLLEEDRPESKPN